MPIYLDFNSTTPVDPRVLEAMIPYFSEKFGNAASKTHSFGWVAEAAVEKARERVAKLIGANPNEIILTSGATEAINLALKGAYEAAVYSHFYAGGGEMIFKNHIITVSTEHKAVLDTCKFLETKGAKVTYLPVDRYGLIDLDDLSNAITPSTLLVCIMYANNETGVIQPIEQISKVVHEKGSCLMTDATQAVGKVRVSVSSSSHLPMEGSAVGGFGLLAFSSHKIYGPKGAGALFVRRKHPRMALSPLIHGGGHEHGLRSGTLNVPAIVGFGKACEIAMQEMESESKRISELRDELQRKLVAIGDVYVSGIPSSASPFTMKGAEAEILRLPNTINLLFQGIKADSLIAKLPDIAFSTGSACTSAIAQPSHVLKSMGLSDEMAYSSMRFSLGKYTTKEEIEIVSEKLKAKIKEMRS